MAVSLGTGGQADFGRPIELMMDCHRRIEHFMDVLERVVERHGDAPLDDEGRRALETSLEYFRNAAPHHTADEEESLFPRLRSLSREDLGTLLDEAERLEKDHERAGELHGRVDIIGRGWLSRGQLEPSERKVLLQDLATLRELYAEHIALEDERVFPAASKVLPERDLVEIGREMAERRGVSLCKGET